MSFALWGKARDYYLARDWSASWLRAEGIIGVVASGVRCHLVVVTHAPVCLVVTRFTTANFSLRFNNDCLHSSFAE